MNASNPSASPLNASNLVVLRGHVSSEPRLRALPSGTTVLQLEVTTPADGAALSVPVAWYEPTRELAAGDEIAVVGHVRRRFYRAGGVTQSRTEVVADGIAPARRRDLERLVRRALAALGAPPT